MLRLEAAWMEQNHMDYEKESAMAKMYASDVAMSAAIEGVQIFGGHGYSKEYPAERHYNSYHLLSEKDFEPRRSHFSEVSTINKWFATGQTGGSHAF